MNHLFPNVHVEHLLDPKTHHLFPQQNSFGLRFCMLKLEKLHELWLIHCSLPTFLVSVFPLVFFPHKKNLGRTRRRISRWPM